VIRLLICFFGLYALYWIIDTRGGYGRSRLPYTTLLGAFGTFGTFRSLPRREAMTNTMRQLDAVKRVRGPVARLDALDEYGRRLESAGALISDEQVPIMALPPGGKRSGHAGAVLVGRGRLSVHGNLLYVEGQIDDSEVEVPIGKYLCGLDVRSVHNDVEMSEDTYVFRSWTPIGVTLHLDGGRNAFAGLEELEVTES
jgi:hypothetical protein